MLTGNKDVDRKILNELDDVDLVKACQVNKQAHSICKDQVFWMNRVFQRYNYVPGVVLRKYKGKDKDKNRTWSDYYIHDLRKINKNSLIDGSKNGRLDHVIIALKNGANIRAELDQALKLSSKNGHLEVVKFLVEQGANIHAEDDYALRFSSEKGHLDTVKFLVENGANIHAQDDYALKLSSKNGCLLYTSPSPRD